VSAPQEKTSVKIFRSSQIPQILGRWRFCLAQQSVLPSFPKSGLTTPCKDWEIWDWDMDHEDLMCSWIPVRMMSSQEREEEEEEEEEEETKKSC